MSASGKRKNNPLMPSIRLHSRLQEIGAAAAELNMRAFLVGGAVRDLLLGHLDLDWDIVVEGDPEPLVHELSRRWPAKVTSHRRFGTFVLTLSGGRHIDFATARKERYPRPGILPLVIPSDLDQDLFRRDFTVNALALALNGDCRGNIIDLHGGQRDLERRMLRVMHAKSFRDDPTRLFRLARFAGRGFTVDRATEELAVNGRKYLRYLSDERVREEILAILAEKDPYPSLCLLDRWCILKNVLPGVRLTADARLIKKIRVTGERLYFLLKDLPRDSFEQVLRKLKLPRALNKEIRAQYMPVKPAAIISGADLIRMGYQPGPLFGKILRDLAHCGLSSRRAARRYVFDKYPQKI